MSLEQTFKILANGTRLRILHVRLGELTVSVISTKSQIGGFNNEIRERADYLEDRT